jgi:TetR/AcrR family tetracycline transcriptional repressor
MGIKAASVYNHVRNKDNLLALIADAICGQVSDIDQASAWRDQLHALAVQFRRALVAHRDGARIVAATPPLGPNRLRIIEQVLRALVSAGFSTVEAADVASVHNSFVVGFVLDETLGGANDKASLRRTREAGRRWFKSLSRDQYPTLVDLADQLVGASTDRRFSFGVEALLDGFASRLSGKRN